MEEKIHPDSVTKSHLQLSLPFGLIGFPQFNNPQLIQIPEEAPFFHLCNHHPETLEFIVLQPYGLLADYSPEIAHQDLLDLNIVSQDDALLFNIITVNHSSADTSTINLIAPILLNQRTLIGKQIIINNFQDYSPIHPLLS